MKEHSYLPGLDLVRISGILTVVVYHYQVETAALGLCPVQLFPDQAELVQVGVYGMTILSGACLSRQEKNRTWSLKRYFAGRFWAIYPLFWSCFFPVFLYSDLLCGNNRNVASWKILFSVAGVDGYLQSFTPTFYKIGEWYLGCILFLYALFPLFWRLVRRRGPFLVLASGAFIWLVGPFLFDPVRLYPTLAGQMPLFLTGIFLGWYLPSVRLLGMAAGLVALVSAFLGGAAYWTVTAAAAAVFALTFSLGQSLFFGREKLSAVLRWLSRRCFGVFLVHHLAITLAIIPFLEEVPSTLFLWSCGLLLLTAGSFGVSFFLECLCNRVVCHLRQGTVIKNPF